MGYTYSLVLPAFNEEESLAAAVEKMRKATSELNCEIIIAHDGSSDGTLELARRLARKYSGVRVIHCKDRLGRGRALENAFSKCKSGVVAYADIDLSTRPEYIVPLLEAAKDSDFVVGSRYLPQSRVSRYPSRLVLSSAYNSLVRLVLNSRVSDHQCGFKAFGRASVLELCKSVKSKWWFWDTEVLVRAQKAGYQVREIPVEWAERKTGQSKVDALGDAVSMLASIARLRLDLWLGGVAY